MSLSHARILVTGATGFIGSRLVQWLVEVEKARVVAFVHQFKNASRISRYPVEMVQGDVTDVASLKKAMEGCTHVVHAAVTFAGTAEQNRAITVDGARTVCDAARSVGISRVVYLSTIDVYGTTPPGVIDESTSCHPSGSYGQDKLDAEQVFREAARTGLTPVILRLPVVYGPWSFWSTYPMDQFHRGCVVLPDEGSGICNAMYVDDAVQSIVCALTSATDTDVVTCLVSGPDKISWKQFYEEHGKARGDKPAMPRFLPKADILAGYHGEQFNSTEGLLRRLWNIRGEARIVMRLPGAGRILNSIRTVRRNLLNRGNGINASPVAPLKVAVTSLPDILPDAAHLELMASQSFIESRAAEKLIGFRPSVSFAEGIEKTRLWLLWANLVG